MERKIGETFEFEGKILQVTQTEEQTCMKCYFEGRCKNKTRKDVHGDCIGRSDGKDVIFEEKDEEQPAPQEEQKLNLCEKLKYCPEGTQFWSSLINTVTFSRIDKGLVFTKSADGTEWDFNPDSTITLRFNGSKTMTSQEPMLFPSREQRDWNKVKYDRPVEKLPKTWQEFIEEQGGEEPEEIVLYNAVGELLMTDDNFLKSVDRHVAMIKLHALRDFYRQGWKPEYNEKSYCIVPYKNGTLEVMNFDKTSRFLSFRDRQAAILFLACFEDIIKEAGDLI